MSDRHAINDAARWSNGSIQRSTRSTCFAGWPACRTSCSSTARCGTRQLGRYSFVAADPVEWLAVPADGSDALARLLADADVAKSAIRIRNPQPDLPPFQGGWAGMFGYELARSLEAVPRRGDR